MKLYNLQNQFFKETDKYPYKFTGIIEYSVGTKQWYVDGKLVSEEQCKLLHSIIKLKGLIQ